MQKEGALFVLTGLVREPRVEKRDAWGNDFRKCKVVRVGGGGGAGAWMMVGHQNQTVQFFCALSFFFFFLFLSLSL